MDKMFDEAFERLNAYHDGLQKLSDLTLADNFKYLTRVERDVIYKTLLDNMGALEDTTKALIKAAREVRRARLRDDDQLSRMVIAMTEFGLKVGDYEGPSTAAAMYAEDGGVKVPDPAPPEPDTQPGDLVP